MRSPFRPDNSPVAAPRRSRGLPALRPVAASLIAVAACLTIVVTPPAVAATRQSEAHTPARTDERYLNAVVRLLVASTSAPSAIGILAEREGDTISEAATHSDRKSTDPAISADALIVSSVARHLVAILAVDQLIEAGQLRASERVGSILPGFRPRGRFGGAMRISDLVSHRSGLVRFPADTSSRSAAVMSLARSGFVAEPGSLPKPAVSDTVLIERIIEDRVGRPYERWVEEEVLRPLGVSRVQFPQPDSSKLAVFGGQIRTIDGRILPIDSAPPFALLISARGLAEIANALAERPRAIAYLGDPRTVGSGRQVVEIADGDAGSTWAIATELRAERSVVMVVGAGRFEGAAVGAASEALLAGSTDRPLPDVRSGESASPLRLPVGRYDSWSGAFTLGTSGDYVAATPATSGRVSLFAPFGPLFMPIDGRDSLRIVADDRIELGNSTLTRIRDVQPAAASAMVKTIVGEYGPEQDVVYVLERDGRLALLHDWRWIADLQREGRDVYRISGETPLARERVTLVRERGAVRAIRISGREYLRRAVGPESGQAQLRIKPVRPVSELLEEARRASPPTQSGDFNPTDLVELTTLDPTIRLDVRYATTNNFLSSVFYSQARAFLQRPAAEAVVRANRRLRERGYGLLVHDAYRPWYVTKVFWEATPADKHVFVANPANGSRHNRGCAVDLTLYELRTGHVVEMVSTYDETTDRAYPDYPGTTALQRWYRQLLRAAMESEGFTVYEAEWWHYDFRDWRRYRIENTRFEELGIPARSGQSQRNLRRNESWDSFPSSRSLSARAMCSTWPSASSSEPPSAR